MNKKWLYLLLSILLCYPISTYAKEELYLGGDSVGIVVHYEGVLISGTYSIESNGTSYSPSDQDILKGDMIVKVGDYDVTSLEALNLQLNKYREDVNEITILIKRGNQTIDKQLISVYDKSNNIVQCGLYVKDKIVGIGTMTYYNPKDQNFGALGHEIQDVDLNEKAKLHSGEIFDSSVNHIIKAQANFAGEKHALINYNELIGHVLVNDELGIYGNYLKTPNQLNAMPWSKKEKVHLGKAKLYTVLSNQEIQAYDIMITKLHQQDEPAIKGIEYEVVDPKLIEKTGGIIQGMSGSPIVQDDCIIGAITHVITSNPKKGYGVYIEWMLKNK
ncbi:MAG: SpoIVB peptidase S55 domain-containing protein [Erysipelotrichaceae bacterium]